MARPPRKGATPTKSNDPLRVFVAGTFDGLHAGHLYLLRWARQRGARLARQRGRDGVHLSVVVARDDSVLRIKGRAPHHTQAERRALVAALGIVDQAFVGYRDSFLRSVRRVQPDLLALGYDQSMSWEEVLRMAGFEFPIARAPEYRGHRLKSSRIRADLEKMHT